MTTTATKHTPLDEFLEDCRDSRLMHTGDSSDADAAVAEVDRLRAENAELIRALGECVNHCADYEHMTDECATAFRNARAALSDALNKDCGSKSSADKNAMAREALENFCSWHADHFDDFASDINAQLLCLANDAEAALAKAKG